jgi:iron-sulfur cluster assembly protein
MSAVMENQFALNMTSVAATKLQSILKERGGPNHGLRVFVSGGGCSGLQYGMALESQAMEQDQILEIGGVKVYVDAASAEYLHGATIDYQDDPRASGFRIDNPNAAPSCSCGSGGCDCGN